MLFFFGSNKLGGCQDRYLIPSMGENPGTLINIMILDGDSCSVFIHLCRVILSSMVEPYCGQSFLEQVPNVFVSGHL